LISLFPVFTFFRNRGAGEKVFSGGCGRKSRRVKKGKLSAGLMCEARQGYTGQVKRDRKKQHEDARHAVCAAAAPGF
jgi:hypothetical protein